MVRQHQQLICRDKVDLQCKGLHLPGGKFRVLCMSAEPQPGKMYFRKKALEGRLEKKDVGTFIHSINIYYVSVL